MRAVAFWLRMGLGSVYLVLAVSELPAVARPWTGILAGLLLVLCLWRRASTALARFGLGSVFLILAWHKVVDPVEFLKAVRDYDMFPLDPPYLMNLTVIALPWIEITAALLLIFGFWLRAAAMLLLAMTAAFTVAVTFRAFDEMAMQGLPLCEVAFDCGCGQGVVFFCSKFAENVGLCALALLVAVSRSRRLSLEALRRPS